MNILVNKDKFKASTNTVHKTLEGLGGIAEAKRHTTELKKAERCSYSGLGNVIVVDRDLVISSDKVDFGKDGVASKVRGKVLNMRQRIAVRGGGVVETSVVSTRAPLTIWLHDHV